MTNMITQYIGIGHKLQRGKSTAAKMIAEILKDKNVLVTNFAKPIKKFCIEILGIPGVDVYGSNTDKNKPTQYKWENLPSDIRIEKTLGGISFIRSGFMTVREVLQVIGTDIFRDRFDPNIWAKAPFYENHSKYDIVIYDDMRFLNEAQEILNRQGIILRIDKNNAPNSNHPSEDALNNFNDWTEIIENNSSLFDLRKNLEIFVDKHIKD